MKIIKEPIFPRLGNNEIVQIGGSRFRAEFINSEKNPRYDFIAIGDEGKENFTRTEKSVSEAIVDKKIKRGLN